jgi:uncharacterized membrane-anchored protein YitT (DUF2179 family)
MKRFLDYLFLTIGSFVAAAGIELILSPNGLVDGGVTAIAIMANHVFGWPIFIVFLVLNSIILAFTAKEVGKKFVIRTSYANIVMSIGLIVLKQVPAITNSDILIVLYGGVLIGIGVGIVVKLGGAIDGTEMLAVWFNNHYRIPISSFLLGSNAIILIGAAIVFSLEKAMFSMAIYYIVMKMIDFFLDGLNQSKSVMIISKKIDEIGDALMNDLNLTITFLKARGGHSGDERYIIYCISNRLMYPRLKNKVLEIDPGAVLEASYSSETSNVRKTSPFTIPEDDVDFPV